jgi:hypothetical protein
VAGAPTVGSGKARARAAVGAAGGGLALLGIDAPAGSAAGDTVAATTVGTGTEAAVS